MTRGARAFSVSLASLAAAVALLAPAPDARAADPDAPSSADVPPAQTPAEPIEPAGADAASDDVDDPAPLATATPPDRRPAGSVARIPEGAAPPVIDGDLSDPAWRLAEPLAAFRQVEPTEGAPPTERTEIRLLLDEDNLYLAFRCFDREPGRIIATQLQRDGSLGADDRIAFIIDTFLDRRNAYYFEINPAGAKGDALIEDNDNFRKEWDGIWLGKAAIDEHGWTAEFAIPAKTISFDPASNRWGFNALRFIRRKNETLRWASPDRDVSFNSVADAGDVVGLEGLRQGIGIDVQPYGLLTYKRDHDADTDGLDADAGLDVFYRITPRLTLALSFNTDFAETEVDERRVNLTRFPLFFPEKRDFFLQDAGIFDFGGINQNPLPFHSRRIGLSPRGEPLDILAAAKLTGRIGDVNLGLLDVQMKDDEQLGSKNYFVGRASLNVLEQSTVGAIFTHGDARSDDNNTLGGLDFNYRTSQFGEDNDKTLVAHAWMQVSDSSDTNAQLSYGGKLIYPNDRFNWSMGYTEIPEEFEAGLGFVPRRGIREYFANWRYRWRPGRVSWIRFIDFGVNGFLVTNLDDEVESRDLTFTLANLRTESDDSVRLRYLREREVLDDAFEISDGVVIPAGDYTWDRIAANAGTSAGRPVSASASIAAGDFYTGTRTDYTAGVEWRASRHLFLAGEWQMNDVDLAEGSFITRILRARANVYFSADLAWTNFIQYDSVSESIGVNSRVRWIIEPGNELFVVLSNDIEREDDNSFRFARTELTTKLGWTFRF